MKTEKNITHHTGIKPFLYILRNESDFGMHWSLINRALYSEYDPHAKPLNKKELIQLRKYSTKIQEYVAENYTIEVKNNENELCLTGKDPELKTPLPLLSKFRWQWYQEHITHAIKKVEQALRKTLEETV